MGGEHCSTWHSAPATATFSTPTAALHVTEHGGAYWLLDEIAIIQPYEITFYFANNVIHPPSEY
jgi:hypothetical protein